MMDKPKITVFIDGEKVDYDGVLDKFTFGKMGGITGSSGKATKEDTIVGHEPFLTVYALAIYGHKDNGDYWDIDGLYKEGSWGKMEDGSPYYEVKGRIA